MTAFKSFSRFLTIAAFAALPFSAQAAKPVSPHETITANVDGDQLSLSYGRPYIKDPKTGEPRKIWGALVPYGQVWRTGANEATVLTTATALVFAHGSMIGNSSSSTEGQVTIPAGSYSLWTVPQADGSAKLVFNKQTGQWGTNHDAKQDFASVELKKDTLSTPVEQFTIVIEKGSSKGGDIVLSWETSKYTAHFEVGQ